MPNWTIKLFFILLSSKFVILKPPATESDKIICPRELLEEIKGYKDTVHRIIDEITNGQFKGNTYDSLANMTDRFGPRMSCSSGLEKTIDYAMTQMREDGLENVRKEKVKVTNWRRNLEYAFLRSPWGKEIPILGLGGSVATSLDGIQSEVIAVETFEELESLPNKQVKGKIVLFVPEWREYRNISHYRTQSASAASRKGAVAALVRSLGPFSLATPHTGRQEYERGVKPIPVACVTVEDAQMMLRMYKAGLKVTVFLKMLNQKYDDCTSYNTIGELRGTKYVDKKVVVVSGHLDSWDVGVGAMDDGGGAMISWKAVEFLGKMDLRPKRTIRAILWTGEEQGLLGSKQYMEDHKENEKEEFNFFMESDSGTFEPRGMDFTGPPMAGCILREILELMAPINATTFDRGTRGGPDLKWWGDRGFPTSSLINDNEKYFWYHHTNADTMNVWESKDTLDRCTALWAAVAYVIADLSVDMTYW